MILKTIRRRLLENSEFNLNASVKPSRTLVNALKKYSEAYRAEPSFTTASTSAMLKGFEKVSSEKVVS